MPNFMDLWIWQKAHKLMLEIHELCKQLPKEERFRLKDQSERSSSSVSDNISEGHSAYYYNEKIKHMLIARKEAGETQNHLATMSGKKYISIEIRDRLMQEYSSVIKGINSYVNYIRQKRDSEKKKKV